MTPTARRKAILKVLCARRFETRANLAEEFGVSKRTIEHDVHVLLMEYSIITIQGNGGGIRVMDGFQLGRKKMSEKQTALLKKLRTTVYGAEKETLEGIIKEFGYGEGGTYDD